MPDKTKPSKGKSKLFGKSLFGYSRKDVNDYIYTVSLDSDKRIKELEERLAQSEKSLKEQRDENTQLSELVRQSDKALGECTERINALTEELCKKTAALESMRDEIDAIYARTTQSGGIREAVNEAAEKRLSEVSEKVSALKKAAAERKKDKESDEELSLPDALNAVKKKILSFLK